MSDRPNTVFDFLLARFISLVPDVLYGFQPVHLRADGSIMKLEYGDWANGSGRTIREGRSDKWHFKPVAIYHMGLRIPVGDGSTIEIPVGSGGDNRP